MFKIISKSKYEAMLTQIEGLKSINDRLFSDKNKLINEYRMLEKKANTNKTILQYMEDMYGLLRAYNLDLKNNIKNISDELSKWKRNRDLVTGRFIKNRKQYDSIG